MSTWQNSDIEQLALTLVAAIQASSGSGTVANCTSSVIGISTSSIIDGTLAATFTTSDDFEGSINGVIRQASTSYVFNPTNGYVNPSITYDVVAGSMILDIYKP